jgi:hypothetical protein
MPAFYPLRKHVVLIHEDENFEDAWLAAQLIEPPRNTTMGVVECPIGAIGVLLTPQPEAKSRAVVVTARVVLRCLQGCRWNLLRAAQSGWAIAGLRAKIDAECIEPGRLLSRWSVGMSLSPEALGGFPLCSLN